MNRRFATALFVGILAVLATYYMVWPLWRLPFPMEIAENEGWNAYHADAALSGGLYPDLNSLILNNYPPLSFYLVGLIAELTEVDALYVGRVLSVLGTVGAGGMIARIAVQLGASRPAGAIGGLWFIAIMARSFSRYVGMNDPQIFAQFLMLCALSWFLEREKAARSATPPVLLMAFAGFYKHNIIAIPATVLVWVTLARPWRGLRTAIVGAAAAAVGLLICIALFGDAFLANLLMPRPMSFKRVLGGTGRLQFVAPALILWAVWAWQERWTRAARFTALWIAFSLAAYLLQYAGEDVLDNAQFDLVIATAVGLGLAFDRAGATVFGRRYGESAARSVVVVIVIARLLATFRNEPFLILTDPSYRAQFYANAVATQEEADRLAATPGDVACERKVVCRMAGKPFIYDDFRVHMIRAQEGKLDQNDEDFLAERNIRYFRNDPRSDISSLHRAFYGQP